jgi:3-oxoacyl-[acyl-carrier protein] reductase
MIRYDLNERRAIVTGAASGIGAATAERLRDEGARVLAVDLNPIEVAGVETLQVDVSQAGAASEIVEAVTEKLGGLDILANIAGVAWVSPVDGHDDALWQQVHDINLNSVFRLCRAALPLLKQSAAGRIVNIGSICSSFGVEAMAAYVSSKHAVLGLTKVLASEAGPFGITVNCIQPGAILTGITKPTFQADPAFEAYFRDKAALKRIGKPEEIASVIAFLCSKDASFISGHGIFVDGGAMQRG